MRFDSPEHLVQFQESGRFPAIHNEIFSLIVSEARGQRFLDLCCSTGLLAQRIASQAGGFVIGVDSDKSALKLAAKHGVKVRLEHMRVGPESFSALGKLIADNQIDVLVARRCIPELMGHWPEFDTMLAKIVADAGVQEIFLEGRIRTQRAINRLSDVQKEAQVFGSRFVVEHRRGQCLRLQRMDSLRSSQVDDLPAERAA